MRTMRTILFGTVLLTACSPPPPPAPPRKPPPFTLTLTTKPLMDWVIDPAADAVWESVKSISTMEGTKEIAPQNDEQWATVRAGAATLVEAGNMLMIEGRARDDGEWMASAKRLSAAGETALRAVDARKPSAVFEAGGQIYNACQACHTRYANFDRKEGISDKGEKK